MFIEHGFIATPICGPSRQALYTGQFPQRNGYMGHGVQPPRWWKNQGATTSITARLHDAGYLTGLIGKHGSNWCRFSVPSHGSNADTGMGRNPEKYAAFVRNFLTQAKKAGQPFFLAANAHDPHRHWARHRDETAQWINDMMGDASWHPLENGKPYPDPKTQFDPADCPMPASYPNDDRLKNSLATYYDSVNRMDEVVGSILRELNESGLAENTLVLFLSDHGMAWDLSKWSLYPAGTKTPLLVRWPGKITPGTIDRESVVSVVDIAPTLAEVCNLSPMQHVDGSSFRSLLNGQASAWKRRQAFSCFNYMNNLAPINESIDAYTPNLAEKNDQYRPSRALNTTQFSYVWNGWANGSATLPRTMLGELQWLLGKYHDKPSYAERIHFIKHRAPEELYDIVKDPGCQNNLANSPEYRVKIDQFRKQLAALLAETKDHEVENYRSFLQAR